MWQMCGTVFYDARLAGMTYHLFEREKVSPQTLVKMTSVFEEVCAELGLKAVQDRLRDIVAERIVNCVRRGETERDVIKSYALKSLRVNGTPDDDSPLLDGP
jgi:hypothetical protein